MGFAPKGMCRMGAPPDPRVDDQAPLSREVEGWAQQYGPALRRYFQKKVNATEAEDLVQNVFLNIQSRGAEAGAIENVEGYLFRTAANVLARRLGRDAWNGDPLTVVVEPQDELSPERCSANQPAAAASASSEATTRGRFISLMPSPRPRRPACAAPA